MELNRITRFHVAKNKWVVRLFCLMLAALTISAAVMFLRVTVNAPLGGDDCAKNPSSYITFTQEGVWNLILADLRDIGDILSMRGSRLFGMPVVPTALAYWARGTIQTYRMYIIAVTCLTMLLFAWLLYRVSGSRSFGLAVLALVPLTICLWNDYQLNGMYSYSALPQTTLLVGALAGHCTVSWAKSRRWYWAAAAALTTFWVCTVYELGYVYIFMTAFFVLSIHERFRDCVVTLLAPAAGEATAFLGYLFSLSHGEVYSGVKLAEAGDENRFLETWLQQMSGGFPFNEILAAGVHVEEYTKGDWLWAFVLAATAGLAIWLVSTKFSLKQLVCFFAGGSVLLAMPAALIAASSKYQTCGWVTWERAYIPAVVESFGVALMVLTLLAALFQWLRSLPSGKWLRLALMAVVVAAFTLMGAFQRAATRERYPVDCNDSYNRLWRSIESGLANQASEDDLILCTYDVWGGNNGAESAFFSRYAGHPLQAMYVGTWERAGKVPQPDYYLGLYGGYGGYDVLWFGTVKDAEARLVCDVRLYVDNNVVPQTGVVKYYVDSGEGEILRQIPLSELDQSESDAYNGYFVCLEDDNIVAPKIMIWAS